MKAHTPGPLEVIGRQTKTEIGGFTAIGKPGGVASAYVATVADAKLYAAAPDLLVEHTAACDAADAILAIMTMEFGRLMVEGPDEEIEITMCGHTVRIPAHKFNKLYNATTRAAISKASTP